MFPIYCVNGSATFPGFGRGSPSVGSHTACFLGSESSWPSQAIATIEIWNFATTEMWDNTGPLPLADDVRQKGCWTGVLSSSKFPLVRWACQSLRRDCVWKPASWRRNDEGKTASKSQRFAMALLSRFSSARTRKRQCSTICLDTPLGSVACRTVRGSTFNFFKLTCWIVWN